MAYDPKFDGGLFDGGLFGEHLFDQPFDQPPPGIRAYVIGESALIGRATAIHAAMGVMMGEGRLIGRATAIHAASGIIIGESELIGVGSRVRKFPPRTGFRVYRWGAVR